MGPVPILKAWRAETDPYCQLRSYAALMTMLVT